MFLFKTVGMHVVALLSKCRCAVVLFVSYPPLPPPPLPTKLCECVTIIHVRHHYACPSPLYKSVIIIHEQTTPKGDVEKRLGQYYGSLFFFFKLF